MVRPSPLTRLSSVSAQLGYCQCAKTVSKNMPVTLRSKRAMAVIEPSAGGRLRSLVIDGHEVIGSVPKAALTAFLGRVPAVRRDWYRGSFPLAPWAGTLPGGEFEFDGVRYVVESDTANVAQHGVIAECEWRITDDARAEGKLTLSTPFGPGLVGRWPFEGCAVQSFMLDETTLKMCLEIHSAHGRMPAIAGYHPWFRRELDSGALASVSFTPAKRLVAIGKGLVTSEDLGERPWDDLFVELSESPRISWPDGPTLTLESDAVVWVYFERMPVAFCVEPWTGANEGLETEWTKIVTPSDPLTLNFTISFG